MADELADAKLETTPTNRRFPTTNQAKACYMYYNSWHQCKYDYSDEETECKKLKGWAMSMCPIEWVRRPIFSLAFYSPGSGSAAPLSSSDVCFILPVQVENWEKQRESGTYPGPVPGEKKGGDHH